MSISFVLVAVFCLIVGVFFVAFELSAPKARDLVLVSELVAVCICARALFNFVPYFNPVIGLVMLCGVGLGVRKGFVVGALTVFISNFIFGQGPWTLYQMVTWGSSGALFGVLSNAGVLRKSEWKLKDHVLADAVSFVLILFVTGPVTDVGSFLMIGEGNLAVLKAVLMAGFFFNLMLALSTVVTLGLCAGPVLYILSRSH